MKLWLQAFAIAVLFAVTIAGLAVAAVAAPEWAFYIGAGTFVVGFLTLAAHDFLESQ